MRRSVVPVALVALAALLVSAQQQSRQPAATDRVSGTTRIETAVAVAQRSHPDGAGHALLASDRDWPDALAGAALAGRHGAPVLLTPPEQLAGSTADELDRLGASRVTILGGTAAVSQEVARDLEARGLEVDRVSGPDRFATAAAVARAIGASGIGAVGGERTVMLASASTFADALAGGPASADRVLPVLLTRRDAAPEVTLRAIEDLGVQHVVVLGGSAAVSGTVADDLRDRGLRVTRLGGRDRTDTAVQVARWAEDALGFGAADVLLARGDAFPDALAAAPWAGALRVPVLLVPNPGEVSYDLLQFVVDRADHDPGERRIERVVALGGDEAVTPRVLARVADAAMAPLRIITYRVGARGDVDADLAYFSEHVDWTLVDQRGWSLDNDIRFDRVDGDGADLDVFLATGEEIGRAADGCSPDYSCQPAGTNDVYVNVEHWREAPAEWRQHGGTLEAYRHYVVLHEVGHAPPFQFGHIECGDVYDGGGQGRPAPVMEQQTIETRTCDINTWPLPFELERARERALG